MRLALLALLMLGTIVILCESVQCIHHAHVGGSILFRVPIVAWLRLVALVDAQSLCSDM